MIQASSSHADPDIPESIETRCQRSFSGLTACCVSGPVVSIPRHRRGLKVHREADLKAAAEAARGLVSQLTRATEIIDVSDLQIVAVEQIGDRKFDSGAHLTHVEILPKIQIEEPATAVALAVALLGGEDLAERGIALVIESEAAADE